MFVSRKVFVAMQLFRLFTMTLLIRQMDSITINGNIDDDVTFYYRKIPTYPSRLANFTFVVYPQANHEYVNLYIYSTEDHINLEKRCSVLEFGQLGNKIFHKDFQRVACKECKHIVHIQDYIPRNYAFSFGFYCGDINSRSLKGLRYIVHIEGMSNQSTCSPMPSTPLNCSQYYSSVSHPSLLTHKTKEIAIKSLNKKLVQYKELLFLPVNECYQHFYEMACYLFLPKCDDAAKTVIFPCRETCEEVAHGCLPLVPKFASFFAKDYYDCDYLPSLHGNIPCVYKPVICQSPPDVSNATIVNELNENTTFTANSTVEYECIEDEHKIEGHSEITCLYSGKWSQTPRCVLNDESNGDLLEILLPVISLGILIVLGIIVVVRKYRYQKKQVRKEMLTRNRDYDAYVCYCFDTDNDYVMNIILPQLEERHDPPFKLYIDCRDFQIGQSIKENIKEAVENSNSAIIVMTQDFINSYWCKEEFTDCYIEHMKDPAFKLFVIMMQEKEELLNMTEYMESYVAENTYLKQDDPDLITKIAEYLIWVKQPKEKRNAVNEGDEPNETDRMMEEHEAGPV